jgi:Na+-transporting methylmalonyl-CoA/oxaloacetate decarboxylase gamma subunit
VLQDDAHALAGRGKGENLQHFEDLRVSEGGFNCDLFQTAVLKNQTERLCDFDEGDLIGRGCLKGADSLLHSGGDIVAEGETGDEIPDDEILVALEGLVLLAGTLTLLHALVDVLHGSAGALVVLAQDGLEQALVLRLVAAHIVDRQLLEHHLVLRQRARLVRKDVVHAAQLLRNLTVAGEGALDLLVVVDAVGEEGLGDVEVDSQTDGDDAGEQQDLPEEVQQPVFAQAPTEHDEDGEDYHEAEEHLRQVVQLLVCLPHLLPRVVGVHHAPHLPSSVHHYPNGLAVGQEAVAPKGIIQIEAFPHAVVLRTGLHLEDSLKIVDVELGRLRLHCGQQAYEVAVVVVLQVLVGEGDGLAQLPIGLAIELVGADEDSAILLRSAENDQIGRDALVGFDLNHLSYLQVATQDLPRAGLLDERVGLVVGFLVALLAVVVVVGLLEEREAEDEEEGREVGEEEADLEHADELAERDEEEEEVEEVAELVVEHQRQEGDPAVLAVVQQVRLADAQRVDVPVQVDHPLLGHWSRTGE